MKISDINISTKEIEEKINKYNEHYIEITTKKHILSRVIANCNNENKETLI